MRGLHEDMWAITVGMDLLADALHAQAVPTVPVDWSPSNPDLADALARIAADPRRAPANAEAVRRITAAGAHLVDVRPAHEALGLTPGTFLHSGPPLTWDRASGPMRGALIGAVLFEGLADTPERAEQGLAEGTFTLEPCHHHGAVGPMAGVVSASMSVFDVVEPGTGRHAFCTLNEGLGKVLRYGAYDATVLERLRWMEDELAPLLRAALRAHGPVDTRALLAASLHMGDESHIRPRAGSALFLAEIVPELVTAGAGDAVARAARFIADNDFFFLNLAMPTAKLAMDAARDLPGSTVVVAMARNGTDFGIRLAGTGDRWFTGPAQLPRGVYLGGYGPADANPDIGDSAITETLGLGGLAGAAAPAVVGMVGGLACDALATTESMYEITLSEHPAYQIPALDFRGVPTAIDAALVARTGTLPVIHTGIAGRIAGTGQVGGGIVAPPLEAFTSAIVQAARHAPHVPRVDPTVARERT
ncbi:DUF1116 domain-containing protein [Embleya sp. NPDC001921]